MNLETKKLVTSSPDAQISVSKDSMEPAVVVLTLLTPMDLLDYSQLFAKITLKSWKIITRSW